MMPNEALHRTRVAARRLALNVMVAIMKQKVEQYITNLVARHPGIKSIWLFGSRANNSYREDSDWDLLVFANQQIFNELKETKSIHDHKIDLLIVFNNKDFENPWPDEKDTKKGTLKDWEWNELSPSEATYKSVKYKSAKWFKEDMIECKTLKALKIWPEINGQESRT